MPSTPKLSSPPHFLLHFLFFFSILMSPCLAQQPNLANGLEPPRQRIKNTLGGFYSGNVTLYFRNSPYRVEQELVVESSCTMTIETGVQMYFDSGVGMKVFGTLRAVGNEFAHIQMLPYQEQLNYDDQMPDFRLIDGPTVRQGRFQVRFRDRWRSVCTQVSNWTSVDTGVACRSMGYSDGGFWRFYRRNNDTFPFVMAQPKCTAGAKNLWECQGLANLEEIALSENLCQGEDDLGLYCWGAPSFRGWSKHWKGLQIFHSPFSYLPADPDGVSLQRESHSRLEFLDILFAGYDGLSKNTTAALYVEGVPPLMNGLRVERSARDGIWFFEPDGPILIANSTLAFNRGHGIAVENALDGRFFVNQSRIEGNWGDGIWYKQKHAGLSRTENFLGLGIGQAQAKEGSGTRQRWQTAFVQRERARVEMCLGEHQLPRNMFFPHLVQAQLANGTALADALLEPHPCWLTVALPARLPYAYTIQFIDVLNRHPANSSARTNLLVCEGNASFPSLCQLERYRVPLLDGLLPQSISLNSNGQPIFLGIQHIPQGGSPTIAADVQLLFLIHASVNFKAFYGLNVTNSAILNNTGNGIQAIHIRDRAALHNVSVDGNQGLAGLLVRDGAADIWLNDTSLSWNWGDGVNISYAGGSINLNSSRLVGNRWRGLALHHNASTPFWALRQELVLKGRPGNNLFYPNMQVAGNLWGGILVGNFCSPSAHAWAGPPIEPRVLISWTEFADNHYHPHIELFACQQKGASKMHVDISGNTLLGGTGMGFRMEPCVNTELVVNSNRFHGISNTALLVRNANHPQLAGLPAKVSISKNDIKMNTAQFIVSIGLNEGAEQQSLVFNQQNEVRANTVPNPFPFLKPRSTPYAALVVSSSNVLIRHNCFGNPHADFEIGTELTEHAKSIDARENNWGDPQASNFMHRIFDQFNRYSLASIEVNPFAAVCNQRAPALTLLQQFFRPFRQPSQPFLIGGTVFENSDLAPGKYTVTEDLHITPGAKLTLAGGTTLEFMNGIGMLVQGELLRNDPGNPLQPIVFTNRPLGQPPQLEQIRLVDEFREGKVLAGRLEVRLGEEWGTVCNRSWTAQHAQLACNQLGLTLDPEHFENWRIFPPAGDLPLLMDNIRCEEREFDLTRCRHDGPAHNVRAGCRASEVVGLRCAPPHWAGVRYSLLASPPTVTGQPTMSHWVLERAGLFDFRTSTFSPALQIDWNFHSFRALTIRDNFFDGLDIVYNDLTRKPTIRDSLIARNRRNGMVLRSMGLSAEKMLVEQNGNAGLRYSPRIGTGLQRDIVSWLDRQEQPELEANGVFLIQPHLQRLQVFESQLDQRKFLVAKPTADCPILPTEPCTVHIELEAVGHEYGLPPRLVVQLVNRPNNSSSDEEAILEDRQTSRRWSVRHNAIQFPLLASGPRLRLTYRRSFGQPSLVLLVLFLDHQEYLDRFLHFYDSTLRDNQYGISALHHSTMADGEAIVNRYAEEKLWFQRVNFTRNREAVIWVHSPEYAVPEGTPLAEISWHVDNCSVVENGGALVADTHRDLFASANIFHWHFWSNTFANNSHASLSVHLPDSWDLLAAQKHSFWMTENRFESNLGLALHLSGFFAFANISSNNFTDNLAPADLGLVHLSGMEKRLVLGRNRFLSNWGQWMVRLESSSHALQAGEVPSSVQSNYFQFNHFLRPSEEYVEMWPRSYALGIFGLQRVEVHFNRLRNVQMDFELVAGCKPQLAASEGDVLNVTHNWWGVANEAEVGQRIFDLEDWNSLSRARFSPFYSSEEQFINFWWWEPGRARLSFAPNATDPPAHDLRGRLWGDKKLELDPERWHPFPYHYRPFRPYRITRDLTVMPGATLTIEKNVEVHVWPNVRILVYGNLIADGTLWQPIRFKPINSTEFAQQRAQQGTRYRRHSRTPLAAARRGHRLRHLEAEWRHLEFAGKMRRRRRGTGTALRGAGQDDVFRQFPEMRRENPQMQRLLVFLMENGTRREAKGFLHFYNATSGELVPSCDRHFTLRNAQVVCRELGLSAQNAFHWLTPQWDYNPRIRLLKTYMEPRQCRGAERRLDECVLRVTGLLSDWQCMDNEHFNYVHCGPGTSLDEQYIGHWGGITFARHGLEQGEPEGHPDTGQGDRSVLRHVELVGGGRVHNDSLLGAALQVIQRSPLLENVNVTNSSLDGLHIVHPSSNMVLSRLNISDNHGIGLTVLAANLQSSASSPSAGPHSLPRVPAPLNLPYQMPGLLDICASGREVPLKGRILLFYKYDSLAVDCVKMFRSVHGRHVGFRFLQANLYPGTAGVPRQDGLSVFAGSSFSPSSLLRSYTAQSGFGTFASQSQLISLHLRATAASGEFGFLAEVATLPAAPLAPKGVEEVAIRVSRLLNNDRGAMQYRNVGELGPNVIVEQCAVERNGYHLFGNISTSLQAIEFHVQNTALLLFRANSLRSNQGGLLLSASSSSTIGRMNAVVKGNAFAFNSNSTVLALFGNGLQRAVLLNNLFIQNYALYTDTILVNGISSNFSHNLIGQNVGWHTVDTERLDGGALGGVDMAQMHFLDNFFVDNLALGHGNPYLEKYGFHEGRELDEFTRRPKRQVLTQRGISFDWWTHVGSETARYRSTVLAGSTRHHFARNVFNDPLNDFELTSSAVDGPQFDPAEIDARYNYWGPPGTAGVAAGKIRDQRDSPSLARVQFEPVLESNTSLIEGDCPAGWFQMGQEEFKSCFLFVGASSTYAEAVSFCQRMDSFLPILRSADSRQKELALRVDQLGQFYVTDVERFSSFGIAYDIPIWVASVTIPSNQCGWMSSRTASIGEQNCHNLLPFLCEKGTKPYHEPVLWRPDFLLVIVLLLLLFAGILSIAFCACRKAQRKEDNFPRKKEFLRDSIRSSRQLMRGDQQQRMDNGNGNGRANEFVPMDAFRSAGGEGGGGLHQFWVTKSDTDAGASGIGSWSGSNESCYRSDSLLSTDTYAELPAVETGKSQCPVALPDAGGTLQVPMPNKSALSLRNDKSSSCSPSHYSTNPTLSAHSCCCASSPLGKGNCPNCSYSTEVSSETRYSSKSTAEELTSTSSEVSANSDSTLVVANSSAAAQPLLRKTVQPKENAIGCSQSNQNIALRGGGAAPSATNSTLKQKAMGSSTNNGWNPPNVAGSISSRRSKR